VTFFGASRGAIGKNPHGMLGWWLQYLNPFLFLLMVPPYYYLAKYFAGQSGEESKDLEIGLQSAAFGAGENTLEKTFQFNNICREVCRA
jgi:hypothetical protein